MTKEQEQAQKMLADIRSYIYENILKHEWQLESKSDVYDLLHTWSVGVVAIVKSYEREEKWEKNIL